MFQEYSMQVVDFGSLPNSLESLVLTTNSVTMDSLTTLEKVTSLKKLVVMDSLDNHACRVSAKELQR